jgi:hypothetical protein
VRTRTITDSLNPRWNKQYTWQVYDPCTVLTVAVFDNWRMFAGPSNERQEYRIRKVRVRVSTLESNRAYTASYPLLVLLRSGLKKMGEVQLAVRFSSPAQLPDTWATYTTPLLPRMPSPCHTGAKTGQLLWAQASRHCGRPEARFLRGRPAPAAGACARRSARRSRRCRLAR